VCWLALAATLAFGQPGANPAVSFGLYTGFDREPSPPMLDSLKRELALLMSPVGLSVEWRSLAAPRDGKASQQLAVVTFKGACDLSALIPQNSESGALGWTHATDGHVLPFSEVDCDQVRAFLSRALIRLWPESRDEAFARAVARVLAHELYHVLSQTVHHGSSGVAQRSYTVAELMAEDFSFAEADQRALSALVAANRPHDSSTQHGAGESLFSRSGCINCHGAQGEGTSRGPSLRAGGRSLDAGRLAVRLAGKASQMYRRARAAGIQWPPLAKPEIEDLVTCMRAFLE
jgi:mono/diheme cytochrome c family protein